MISRWPHTERQARHGALALLVLALAARLRVAALGGGAPARASADPPAAAGPPAPAPPTVLEALGQVTHASTTRASQANAPTRERSIKSSRALREAIEPGDAGATRTAAQALIATGHLTNLR